MRLDHKRRDEAARNTAQHFLANWSLRVEELIEFAPEIQSGECLCLMGSIPEGLSNEQSDIDLLYIGEGGLTNDITMHWDTSYKFGISHNADGREINVEQLTLKTAAEYGDRFNRSLKAMDSPGQKRGNYVERSHSALRMLHRIWMSVPLVNEHILHEWRDSMKLERLHKFLCLGHAQDLLNQREDIWGEVQDGQLASAAWMVRTRTIPSLVATLLTSIGETNTVAKWHGKLLLKHANNFDVSLLERLTELSHLSQSELEADTVSPVNALIEDVLEYVRREHRDVRRALTAFSAAVRYFDPQKSA